MNSRNRFVRYSIFLLLVIVVAGESQRAPRSSDFLKLDAASLPISHKIEIGGDPDWLAIGFGSVWVAVPKTNEVVRVDPVHNSVQARVPVDKEPCYGIGVGAERVWVLNCQGQTLTRIDPRSNKVDLSVPVKIDTAGEGSIAVDARSVWFVSNEDGHSSTLTQADVKTGRTVKQIPVGKDSAVVRTGFGSIWVVSSAEGRVYRVNPVSRRVVACIPVGGTTEIFTGGGRFGWGVGSFSRRVCRIHPPANKKKGVKNAPPHS